MRTSAHTIVNIWVCECHMRVSKGDCLQQQQMHYHAELFSFSASEPGLVHKNMLMRLVLSCCFITHKPKQRRLVVVQMGCCICVPFCPFFFGFLDFAGFRQSPSLAYPACLRKGFHARQTDVSRSVEEDIMRHESIFYFGSEFGRLFWLEELVTFWST